MKIEMRELTEKTFNHVANIGITSRGNPISLATIQIYPRIRKHLKVSVSSFFFFRRHRLFTLTMRHPDRNCVCQR
jgi:hypothetical protein